VFGTASAFRRHWAAMIADLGGLADMERDPIRTRTLDDREQVSPTPGRSWLTASPAGPCRGAASSTGSGQVRHCGELLPPRGLGIGDAIIRKGRGARHFPMITPCSICVLQQLTDLALGPAAGGDAPLDHTAS